jgi:hypothetical protein
VENRTFSSFFAPAPSYTLWNPFNANPLSAHGGTRSHDPGRPRAAAPAAGLPARRLSQVLPGGLTGPLDPRRTLLALAPSDIRADNSAPGPSSRRLARAAFLPRSYPSTCGQPGPWLAGRGPVCQVRPSRDSRRLPHGLRYTNPSQRGLAQPDRKGLSPFSTENLLYAAFMFLLSARFPHLWTRLWIAGHSPLQ